MDADARTLLDVYEATGDEDVFVRAKSLYEQRIAATPDAQVIRDYGYLLECHGRYTLRQAVAQYDRSIALDPDGTKARYQRISARAALGDTDEEIRYYMEQLAAAPDDLRPYRCLAAAYLAERRYDEALTVVEAGLRLNGDDRTLIEYRGQIRAGTGDSEGALADWRQALHLDPEDISPLHATAFLFEREGRHSEAIAAWEAIRDWAQARGYTLDTGWPQRELERLRRLPRSSPR